MSSISVQDASILAHLSRVRVAKNKDLEKLLDLESLVMKLEKKNQPVGWYLIGKNLCPKPRTKRMGDALLATAIPRTKDKSRKYKWGRQTKALRVAFMEWPQLAPTRAGGFCVVDGVLLINGHDEDVVIAMDYNDIFRLKGLIEASESKWRKRFPVGRKTMEGAARYKG